MKIALMGTRGIPACYSGFETFYEQLGKRLIKRGYDVTVYNRSNYIKYKKKFYKGIRLVKLPTIRNKHLDTIFHTFISVLHGIFKRYAIIYFCIVGNSPLTIIPRIFGAKTILNVDGADWEREKWGSFAKKYIKLTEYLATIFPNIIIADSKVIQRRYQEDFKKETVFISYGANIIRNTNQKILKKYGLKKDKYILFVGRLVPENGAHLLIEAYNRINTDLKLVIVGDAPYSENYKKELRFATNNNIIFTGYVFGKGYKSLSCNAYFYVLPSGIDGTRPALLDQMAFGNCVLVRNSSANIEVVGDAGLSFDIGGGILNLKEKLISLLNNPKMVHKYRDKAIKRVKEHYSWENIADEYDKLFKNMVKK